MPVRQITNEEARLLRRAEEILVRDCMARQGFRYWVVQDDVVPAAREFPYVVDDVAWARKHGYGSDIRQRTDALKKAAPNTRYFESLPAARKREALAAMNGERPVGLEARIPTGGVMRRSDRSCVSEAERKLYGDLKTWYRVKEVNVSLKQLRRSRVIGDARFVSATSRWSRCMSGLGYAVASPPELRASVPPDTRPPSRRREIRAAVAEATCADRTDFDRTICELDAHHERLLAQHYREETTTKTRMELEAVSRAQRIDATANQ